MCLHVHPISWLPMSGMYCAEAARHVHAGDLVGALEARQKRERTGQSNTSTSHYLHVPSCVLSYSI